MFPILLTSCQTLKRSGSLPDISFPDFPVDVTDNSVSIRLENDKVIINKSAENKEAEITAWLWLDFVQYAIDVDVAKQKYDRVREGNK